MSCPIGQSLAFCAHKSAIRTLFIVDAKLGAGVVAEIKFREVAIKVFLVNVLVDADETALEHREEVFKRIGVHLRSVRQLAYPFLFGMIDGRCGAGEQTDDNQPLHQYAGCYRG